MGGETALAAAIQLFVRRFRADPRLSGFLRGVDTQRLAVRLQSFFGQAFGGPHQLQGLDLRGSHSRLQIDDTQFDAVLELLADSFIEVGVPQPLIREIVNVAEIHRDSISTRHSLQQP
jgi:hemoglobin